MKDKRRWNHPGGGRDLFYTYCHLLVLVVVSSHPMPGDSYHHLLPDLLLCAIVGVTPFVLAFHPATHTHILNPHVSIEGRYTENWFSIGSSLRDPPKKTIPIK